MNRTRRTFWALLPVAAALVPTSAALAAFGPLPATGVQLNVDRANGIDPTKDVGLHDVAAGSLDGGAPVPWSAFEQKTPRGQQIFVRSFARGHASTRGFPASLNIDPTQVAKAPSIDFAGPGRTVPWVAWTEGSNRLSGRKPNVFVSFYDRDGNHWRPAGQDRTASAQIPSLNLHTNRSAGKPAVVGGAAVAGANPVPWVAWEERDGATSDARAKAQIFVSRGIGGKPCDGVQPAGRAPVNGFCFQQVGLRRLDPAALRPAEAGDPTLSIDPTRDAQEPDFAFTGPGDTVPWVVWYEEGPSKLGLKGNQLVFAAKAVADATPGAGGFRWQAVGNRTAGRALALDRSGPKGFGTCAASRAQESACSLNKVSSVDAQNPRVAAGSLVPGGATVPWVAWEEEIGPGRHAIFVSRLVGDHFELFNNGQPISNTLNDSTRADITFAGHVPYVSWLEQVGKQQRVFMGHFEGKAFRLDTPVGLTRTGFGNVPDVRPAITSTCTAVPTNADGNTCAGGAIGTAFFEHAAGAPGAQRLYGQGYRPDRLQTLDASGLSATGATLNGSIDAGGAAADVFFDFGTTPDYGQRTPSRRRPASTTPSAFSEAVSGLPAGATLHYRLVALTDYGVFRGPDRTLRTP